MTFDLEYFNIGYLDTLSYKNSFVHRLDPRIKIIVSFIFIPFFFSFPKNKISALMPSFFSIIIKFILTVSTALLLIAVTSFPGVCEALERLKLPKLFVIQLLFLYRYLFVLLDVSLRMLRAREARSFGKRGKEIKTFIRLISVLLVRSVERAERIYQAMLSRGFRGEIRVLKIHRLRLQDVFFAVFSVIIFYIFRNFNIVSFIGENIRSSFR